MGSTSKYKGFVYHQNIIITETFSNRIVIENRFTICISHVPEYLFGGITQTVQMIRGVGGTQSPKILIGVLLWR